MYVCSLFDAILLYFVICTRVFFSQLKHKYFKGSYFVLRSTDSLFDNNADADLVLNK